MDYLNVIQGRVNYTWCMSFVILKMYRDGKNMIWEEKNNLNAFHYLTKLSHSQISLPSPCLFSGSINIFLSLCFYVFLDMAVKNQQKNKLEMH